MVEHNFEIAGVQHQSPVNDWTSRELSTQLNRFSAGSDNVTLLAKSTEQENKDAPQRVFPAGTEITGAAIEKAGIANNPSQLNLERNLLFRDANPNAYFQTPGLNDKINQLTGTQGDSTNPANAAAGMELIGTAQRSALVLRNYEAVAKVNQ